MTEPIPSPAEVSRSCTLFSKVLGRCDQSVWRRFVQHFFPRSANDKPFGLSWENYYSDLYDFSSQELYLVLRGDNYMRVLINNYNLARCDNFFSLDLQVPLLISDSGNFFLHVLRTVNSVTLNDFLAFLDSWIEARAETEEYYISGNQTYNALGAQDFLQEYGEDPRYYLADHLLDPQELSFVSDIDLVQAANVDYENMELQTSSARSSRTVSPASSPATSPVRIVRTRAASRGGLSSP